MSKNNFFQLFVYGTLKRGHWNHNIYCRGAISIEKAKVWGRLYEVVDAGYPVLEIPKKNILAYGSNNPFLDLLIQKRCQQDLDNIPKLNFIEDANQKRNLSPWSIVHGELICLSDPIAALFRLDELEEFFPHGYSAYQRILTPVWIEGRVIAAWTYVGDMILKEKIKFIPSGYWPEY
ncbi:MAG: gamma-glutamylcyclotransferase family protein [Desulfonauticus sp.]|nr:gamma-glutamylcyclotransferase family protein [Desulfonauticus sp.]